MRGFNVGDTVQTQDGKHSGIVEEIRTVKDNKGNCDFEIVIHEKRRIQNGM